MITLYLDVPITRRQRLHHCLDEHGTHLFSSSKASQCFAWLWQNGDHSFKIDMAGEAGLTDTCELSFARAQSEADAG